MKRNLLWLACAVVLAVAGVIWTWWPAPQSGLLPYRDRAVTTHGAAIYSDSCASCHRDDLQGDPEWRTPDVDGYLPAPPHDQTGHTWHHADAQLIEITRFGTEALVGGTYRSRMAGFSDILSEAEIVAVLAYIKSTWPDRVIDQHNRINADAALAGN